MRLVLITLISLMISACGEDKKSLTEKQYTDSETMTCARQSAMFDAGYSYYQSGDRLAIKSNNGDRFRLSEDETDAGYMFDLCNSYGQGGYDNNDYGGYGYGYGQWKNHRHPKDRKKIRNKNNRPRDDRGDW